MFQGLRRGSSPNRNHKKMFPTTVPFTKIVREHLKLSSQYKCMHKSDLPTATITINFRTNPRKSRVREIPRKSPSKELPSSVALTLPYCLVVSTSTIPNICSSSLIPSSTVINHPKCLKMSHLLVLNVGNGWDWGSWDDYY